MNTKKENVAATDGIRRHRIRGMRKFGILSAMSLMTATALVGADCVVNSFVTVEGEGVSLDAEGNICVDKNASGSVTVSARSGWSVNGRESVTGNPLKGTLRSLDVSSNLGEDSGHVHMFPYTEKDDHLPEEYIQIGAEANPSNIIAIYAYPATSAVVSASAAVKVVRKGKHQKTKTYSKCSFASCDAVHDPEEEVDEPYEVEPDHYAWTATAEGLSFPEPTWTGPMTNGLGKTIKFEVTGTRGSCAKCRCEAEAEAKADVFELHISRPDYLGLDMTDAMRGKYVTRSASAVITPDPASATYNWTKCGKCDFIGETNKVSVTYGATDKTGPSDSYGNEKLSVDVTVGNEEGALESTTCTTNFTVVKVDVVIGGVDEEHEEVEGAFLPYVPDTNGDISVEGSNKMVNVSFSCEPALPTNEMVTVSCAGPAELYEELATGELVKITTTNYPACEIASHVFKLHGHGGSGQLCDGLIRIVHMGSGAKDEAYLTVLGLKTETFATTPADRTRKTIGVGEKLTATLLPASLQSVSWSVNGGGSISAQTGNQIDFTATNRAATATITAECKGFKFTAPLSIIEPDGVKMTKICDNPIPHGEIGAEMTARIQLLPTTVSFYNVQCQEMSGPASDVQGYFTRFSDVELYHNASSIWAEFGQDNFASGGDLLTFRTTRRPWSAGHFVWHIPWHFRVGPSDGGKQFLVVDQWFWITDNGLFQIQKAGAWAIRAL